MVSTLGYDDLEHVLKSYDALISEYAGPVALTVGTTPVEVKAGATPLAGRTEVLVFNISSVDVFWGFSNTVTTGNGMPIPAGSLAIFRINPGRNIQIWLVATAEAEVRLVELKS